MTSELKVGDVVQVRDPDAYISTFANKIRNRDAVIDWVGPDQYGQFKGMAWVIFQKRGNRGSTFRERLNLKELVLKAPA